MSDRDDRMRDDGLIWGWMDGDLFVPLPKLPLLRNGLGPPPFDVTLPVGTVRHVVHDPMLTPDPTSEVGPCMSSAVTSAPA